IGLPLSGWHAYEPRGWSPPPGTWRLSAHSTCPGPGKRRKGRISRCCSHSCDDGQGKPESRTFPRRTLHTACSIVLRNERLADIEAQTQSFSRTTLHECSLDLVIAQPDVFLGFLREARPRISHPHTGQVLLNGQTNVDRLIGTRIPDGIGEVVRHHLADAVPIGQHIDHGVFRQCEQKHTLRRYHPHILDSFAYDRDQVRML